MIVFPICLVRASVCEQDALLGARLDCTGKLYDLFVPNEQFVREKRADRAVAPDEAAIISLRHAVEPFIPKAAKDAEVDSRVRALSVSLSLCMSGSGKTLLLDSLVRSALDSPNALSSFPLSAPFLLQSFIAEVQSRWAVCRTAARFASKQIDSGSARAHGGEGGAVHARGTTRAYAWSERSVRTDARG